MVNRISRRQALMLGGGALAGAATLGSVAGARSASAGQRSASAAKHASEAGSPWIRLPVITANIGRKHLDAREAAIRDVRNADGDNRPFVGWQEIQEGKIDVGEPAMISTYFGGAYDNQFLYHDQAFRVPISVPQPWTVANFNTTFVHGGITDITPPRWITEVAVEHPAYPGLKFVMINTHYIAGAYNGAQNPNLRDEWELSKQKHRERVMAHHDHGHLVIWTADTNRADYGNATGQADEHTAYAANVDRINWLPGDGTVQLEWLNTKVIPMNVDGHNAGLAIFRIRLR